jgi:hypothetical protein
MILFAPVGTAGRSAGTSRTVRGDRRAAGAPKAGPSGPSPRGPAWEARATRHPPSEDLDGASVLHFLKSPARMITSFFGSTCFWNAAFTSSGVSAAIFFSRSAS